MKLTAVTTVVAIALSANASISIGTAEASIHQSARQGATPRLSRAYKQKRFDPVETSCGHASWYSLRSRTASGELMNPAAMTAAHKTLPLGSMVRVTNTANGRSVVVKINDRGPFVAGRMIDLSKGAARALDFVDTGVAQVQIEAADGSGAPNCA